MSTPGNRKFCSDRCSKTLHRGGTQLLSRLCFLAPCSPCCNCKTIASPSNPPWHFVVPVAANGQYRGHSRACCLTVKKLSGFTTHTFVVQTVARYESKRSPTVMLFWMSRNSFLLPQPPPFFFLFLFAFCWPINNFNLKDDLKR